MASLEEGTTLRMETELLAAGMLQIESGLRMSK